MKLFHEPTIETLERLACDWCCSYSGGKDSTAMVTWIEYLRRCGWIDAPSPKLVRSDTGVEEQHLVGVAEEMTRLLESCGWTCTLVRPKIHERLYNRILGIGLLPIHPGIRRMRWCTRSTKVDPMERWRKDSANGLALTGLRIGESAMRDDKIKRNSCAAGGECGIPEPGEGKFSPILHWKTCQVMDWLSGLVSHEVRERMGDILAVTKRLVDLYNPERFINLLGEDEVLTSARFGCIGCPAISATREPPRATVLRNGPDSPLNELYDVWFEARLPESRCVNMKKGHVGMPGPIRMDVRKRLFARVMEIQQRAGVTLITPEDEAFIRQCWKDQVYPRGWSAVDEDTPIPALPLFPRET